MKAAAALTAIVLLSTAGVLMRPDVYRALPFMAPDSITYITWDPMRPPAYPAVLSVLGAVSPTLAVVGPFQFVTLAGATALLAATILKATRSQWLAVAFAAGVLLHPQLVSYAFTVLPESLLTSVMLTHIAASIRLARRPSALSAAAAALTLAVAILLKPAAMSFGAGAPIIAAHLWHAPQRVRIAAVWLTALVVPILVASAGNYARSEVFAPQAIGGVALLGVTGTFMPDDTPITPPQLKDDLLARVATIRDDLKRLDSLDIYYFYSSTAYHAVLERSRDAIVEHLRRTDPSATPRQLYIRLDDVGANIAWQTIRRAPREYARHIAAHLYGLWLVPLVQNSAGRDRLEQRLALARAASPSVASEPLMLRFFPPPVYWAFKALLLASLGCSIVAVVGWFRPAVSSRWFAAAYCAVLLHAYFLLTALAQTGLPRYAVTVWPLTLLVIALTIAAASSWWGARRIPTVAETRTRSHRSHPPSSTTPSNRRMALH